ncbi:hypothetical protein D9M68_746890 [compost metagenome]
MSVFEQSVKTIEAELAKEEVYTNSRKLEETNLRYQAEKALLEDAQKNWEALATEIMELES